MSARPAAAFSARRFTVRQERCGMKVGIDAIVLASHASHRLFPPAVEMPGPEPEAPPLRLLDVGCGCGIVALLLRQAAAGAHRRALVTAIDIDAPSAAEARRNVEASPWAADIRVHHTSLQAFTAPEEPFDLIACNPPYFPRPSAAMEQRAAANRAAQLARQGVHSDGVMRAGDRGLWPESRAHARFSDYLPAADMLTGAAALLADRGAFLCSFPARLDTMLLEAAAAAGLERTAALSLRMKAGRPISRVISTFEHCSGGREVVTQELTVRDERGVFSQAYCDFTASAYDRCLRSPAE